MCCVVGVDKTRISIQPIGCKKLLEAILSVSIVYWPDCILWASVVLSIITVSLHVGL